MNRRRLVILVFSLICLALMVGGFLYWVSERWTEQKLQLAEQRLQKYIGRLEDDYDYIFEERPLTEFHVSVVEVYWFSDFRSIAKQKSVSYVYIDREVGTLYFLYELPSGGTEANVFYYTRDFID